eukprot:TRINITY_DN3475_c0_g1_i4.p1 TRINITY_DN3475_c0_g1~~TRINITY_DN3475_c0_g1_i4.p1  ORF type:complete len:342 (-),score=99.28 TRINITY_DN3475_c0_g1_i4:359-1384(-)
MPLEVKKVAVFGAGQFGFALANLIGGNHPQLPVVMYDPYKDFIDAIKNTRQHAVFHKGVSLPSNVVATHSAPEAITDADIVVIAVPGAYVRGCVKGFAPLITKDVILLNAVKALEPDTHKHMSDVVEEEMKIGCKHKWTFVALSGGMLAEEVTKNWPIAADVACESLEAANQIQSLLNAPHFKVNTTTDLIGVELAGSLKNVLAIGAGFFDGLGFETSSKAAYVSEASNEVKQLAIALGAKPETFELGGHAWMGDLLTTCFGDSRNRLFGELIGKGHTVQEALDILEKAKKRSEGFLSTKGFYELAQEKGIKTPILKVLYDVLFEEHKISEIVLEIFRKHH